VAVAGTITPGTVVQLIVTTTILVNVTTIWAAGLLLLAQKDDRFHPVEQRQNPVPKMGQIASHKPGLVG